MRMSYMLKQVNQHGENEFLMGLGNTQKMGYLRRTDDE